MRDLLAEEPVAQTSAAPRDLLAEQPKDLLTEQPQVDLFSTEGVSSIAKGLGPRIARGYHGYMLGGLEEIQNAREKTRARGERLEIDAEEQQRLEDIRKRREAVERLNREVTASVPGKPSYPLELVTGAVQSVATMAPGIAAGVGTGRILGGPIAMIPGLMTADASQYGQSYAEHRVPEDVRKAAASIEESLLNAKLSGLIEAGFEAMPAVKLIAEVGKVGLGRLIRNYMLREYATEIPTTVAQDITEWATVEQDMPIGDFLKKLKSDVIDTALTVPLVAGAGGALAKAQSRAGLAFEPAGPMEMGPSGEMMPVSIPDSYRNVPPPVQTHQPTPEALTTVASKPDPSTITDEQVAEARKVVQDFDALRTAAPIVPETMALLGDLNELNAKEDFGAIAESGKVIGKAPDYINENNEIPRIERQVVYAPEGQDVAGLQLRQIPLTPGTYTVGIPTRDRDADTLKAEHDMLEQWRAQFMPNATLLMMNEGLPVRSAGGWHSRLSSGVHVITPPVLRERKPGLPFNTNAQGKILYTLAHEFGHGLIQERFFEGVDPLIAFTIRTDSQLGLISEEAIAQIADPLKQELLREFNYVKGRVLSGEMTASEFHQEWMNPGKVHMFSLSKEHGVPGHAPALQLVDSIIRRAYRTNETLTPERLQELRNDYLGIDEYFAEQLSRYAYTKEWDVKAPASTKSFIGKALASVRDALATFFKQLKKDGVLAPGTRFQEWMDSLSKDPLHELPAEKIAKPKKEKKAATSSVSKPEKPVKVAPAAKPVEQLDHNVATAPEARQKAARSAIASLIRDGTFTTQDEIYKELMGLVKAADFSSFTDMIQPFLEKKVKFELDSHEDLAAAFMPSGTSSDPNLLAKMMNPFLPLQKLGYDAYLSMGQDELILEKDEEVVLFEDQPLEVQQMAGELADLLMSAQPVPSVTPSVAPKTPAPAKTPKETIAKLEKHLQEIHAAAGYPNVPYWLQAAPTQLTEQESRDPSILADAATEWQKKGFASKYFKAWFGDWQNDAGNASKTLNANEEPLIVYHSTAADFDIFDRGDIGFHFGTVRAAHIRGFQNFYGSSAKPDVDMEDELARIIENMQDSKEFPISQQSWSILPVVLNIRNPLYIGFEVETWWMSPFKFAAMLVQKDIITRQEADILNATLKGDALFGPFIRENFEPVRALLESKGYDGVKYENTVEGDTSWVAFRPEQVKSVLGSRTFSRSPKIHFELDFDEATPEGYTAGRFYQKFKGLVPSPGPLRRALRWAANIKYKGLQLQQQAHLNPALDDLAFMTEKNNAFERFKGELQGPAGVIGERWQNFGKENHSRVNNFLTAEVDGNELWVDLANENGTWVYKANEKFREKLNEHGINTNTAQGEELAELILEIKNSLLDHINKGEAVMEYILSRRYGARPDAHRAALMPLAKDVHAIRSRPFLPQGRFGNHMLTVEQKKDKGPGYEVVYREAFDTTQERSETRARIERKLKPNERVRSHNLTDTEYVLMSLPQDFLEAVIAELGLNEAQRDKLFDLLIPTKREKLLKAYDRERLGVAGASKDVMRSYSNFIWHNSNLLAKTRYRADFNLAIQGMHSLLRKAEYAGDEVLINKYEQLHRFMQKTRDDILNPPNEAYMLRSVVALAYLMGNVKTALLNLFGLVTTWSDITTRVGEVQGDLLMTKASAAAFRSINPFDLNARAKGDYLKPEWQQGLDRALKEGQLAQSYAYHLAGMANASNLTRLPGRNVVGKISRHGIDLGMWVFRLTELSTRRITFLAQLELGLRDKKTFEESYQEAIASTNKLQNDYSMGNRAPFLRGGKVVPLITVFMSFTQHMAFHALGGYETGLRRADKLHGRSPRKLHQSYTLRIVLLLLLLAGYEGLPGAENILDLADAVWKKWFGKPVRQELREGLRDLVRAVTDVDSDPLLLAHGLGHNVNPFGVFGSSGFDVSRSVGFGRIVPGTDVVAKSTSGDFKGDLGALALNVMGPTGGILEWLLKTGFGKGNAAEGMKRAPGAIGNVWNAYQWNEDGVRTPQGSLVTHDLQTGELRDLTTAEVFGKALGFNPTVVSANREILFSQHDARMYWAGRRERLLDDAWKAHRQDDREAVADVRQNIEEFNEEIPEDYRQALRISPKNLADSRKERSRRMRLEERGLPAQKRYRSLYKDVRESFDPSAGREVPER